MLIRETADKVLHQVTLRHMDIQRHLENPNIHAFLTFLDGYLPDWQYRVYDGGDQVDMRDLENILHFFQNHERDRLRYNVDDGFAFMSFDRHVESLPKETWMEEVVRLAHLEVRATLSSYDRIGAPWRMYIPLFHTRLAFTPEMMERWLEDDGEFGC